MNLIYMYIAVAIIGLIIGSFLMVVIDRYPKILQQQWQAECREYLGLKSQAESMPFSLALPRSHCPHCKKPLKFYHNIPLFSYLWLRGKCASCKRHISLLYPGIELLSCILSILVVWAFGPTWQMLGCLLFTYVLITLAFIDLNHQILPDIITISILWIGLIFNTFHLFTSLGNAVWGAVVGYLILWLSAWIFLHLRHKQGMGHGDFKMIAMVGAWFGINVMFNTLLLAIVVGAILSIILLLGRRWSWQRPLPFGPFIAAAAWITMLTGPFIIQYLRMSN